MRSRSSWLLVLVLGCSDPAPARPDAAQPPDACGLQVALKTSTGEALGDGEPIDLVTGFQGFLFVRLAAAAVTGRSTLGGTVSIAIEGLPAYEQAFQDLALGAPDGSGLRTTPELLVFFNQFTAASLSGRRCHLTLRASDGACFGTGSADIVLSAEHNCYQGSDGGTWCVVDGGAP